MLGSTARRPGLPIRRPPGTSQLGISVTPPPKPRFSPMVSICFLAVGAILLFGYSYGDLVFQSPQSNDPEIKVTEVKDTGAKEVTQTTPDNDIEEEPQLVWDGVKASSQSECTASVCGVIDVLQDMYGKNMLRLLHIGPGTCGIVSKLLEESSSEVWGVQPFPMKSPVQKKCQTLVKKGLIRVAEVNQVLPYRSRSFSFVLVTDILDVMKKRDLNTTLPELSRLSAHDLVVIVGNGRPQPIENTALAGQLGKFNKPRTRDWWLQQFHAAGLKEDEEKKTHFEVAVSERGSESSFHIFHLIVPSFSSPI